MERQGFLVLGGSAIEPRRRQPRLYCRLRLTLHISYGGHLGGLAGGALGALALSRFGRQHAAYSRLGIAGSASLVAIGILSIAVAYWKVRGYA